MVGLFPRALERREIIPSATPPLPKRRKSTFGGSKRLERLGHFSSRLGTKSANGPSLTLLVSVKLVRPGPIKGPSIILLKTAGLIFGPDNTRPLKGGDPLSVLRATSFLRITLTVLWLQDLVDGMIMARISCGAGTQLSNCKTHSAGIASVHRISNNNYKRNAVL
jgi:hypothetical protein